MAEPTEQRIEGDGGRKYFTMLPNILDDCDLSPHAFRLLVHYYRVCGAGNSCYEGVRVTAKRTQMSVGTVSKSRKALEKAGWVSLRKEQYEDRPAPTLVVSVKDRWTENMAFYETEPLKVKKKVQAGDILEKQKKEVSQTEAATRKRTTGIKAAYVKLLGYQPQWNQGEGKAARQLAENYTVSQFKNAYTYYKGQGFWQDKKLSLRYLINQMPEWEKANGRTMGTGQGTSGDIGEFLERIQN